NAVKEIWSRTPVKIDRTEFQYIGVNGIHGEAAPLPSPEWLAQMNEIGIRVVIRHSDERAGKLALHAITCLGLNGPPGIVSVPGWGNSAREQLSLWPTLVARHWVAEEIEMVEV
ncbi:MAG: hypothetical protein EAZ89_05655, partial [Bacteroidetes bacterium]